MKTIINLFALLIFLIGGKNAKAQTNDSSIDDTDKISYVVTIDKNNYRLAKVSMTFTPKGDTLYMAYGASALPKRWATFVHNMRAVDRNENSIVIEELSDAKWKLNTSLGTKITVNYEVKLDHENYEWSGGIDGVAYATDLGVFYTGRTLLVLNGAERNNINVDFIVPSDWHVTTPWNALKSNRNSFIVKNQIELFESMIFAGTHEEISIKRGDFELVFALGGDEVLSEKDDYKKLAGGVLDYYINLMGGLPNTGPDHTLNKSVVIINSSTATDGEVIGNNISIVIEKDGGPMTKMLSRFIFAHEFFHLWNGKSFWPSNDETEWFKEGFTNYYTLKSLYHVGFLNDSSYFEILNNLFFQRYNNDDGVGNLSMTKGEEKHAHWGLIYVGGLYVAISQDMIIRKASNNKKSVDDLMKGLFQKYGGTNDSYSLDELRDSLSELSGKDQSDFFNTYITGVKRIPIDEYLSMTSMDAKIEDGNLKIEKKESSSQLQENMTKGMLGIVLDK